MTDLRKAAEMALEALNDDPNMLGDWLDNLKTAREALRQALAQPEQEPVACKHEWVRTRAMLSGDWFCIHCCEWEHNTEPPKREWVGITKEDKKEILEMTQPDERGYVIAITEAKLKEKNGG